MKLMETCLLSMICSTDCTRTRWIYHQFPWEGSSRELGVVRLVMPSLAIGNDGVGLSFADGETIRTCLLDVGGQIRYFCELRSQHHPIPILHCLT